MPLFMGMGLGMNWNASANKGGFSGCGRLTARGPLPGRDSTAGGLSGHGLQGLRFPAQGFLLPPQGFVVVAEPGL